MASWLTVVPFVLLAGVAGWVGHAVVENPTEQRFHIEFADLGKVLIETKGGAIDHRTLLEKLFQDEFGRDGALGWLKAKQRLYSVTDPALAHALQTGLCEPIPDRPLTERLTRARACADHPVASALRRIAREHAVPFHYVAIEARVGVQQSVGHRPGAGRANVCRTGPLVGQRFQVIDESTREMIEVEAAGVYDCAIPEQYPDVQLDPDDATRLFQRPTARVERALVVPL
jgi:hypothetical protein